jgi:acetyl esterase/lipase
MTCHHRSLLATFVLFVLTLPALAQQPVIRLYEGKAPGSEQWDWKEEDVISFNRHSVSNVVDPTLTVYPAKGTNTGTAVIVAPGGGLMGLSWDNEGTLVADWLSQRGITAFVLKYRTAHMANQKKDGFDMFANPKKLDSMVAIYAPLAKDDGLKAVAWVRQHASTYGVKPDRIGFMGFSAGGGLTMSVAYNAKDESRPDFIAPIYAWDKDILGTTVPTAKMPAFVVVAADDVLRLVPTSLDIFRKWTEAKQPVELHIYQRGGHGFGMRPHNVSTDHWIDRFHDWLIVNKLI